MANLFPALRIRDNDGNTELSGNLYLQEEKNGSGLWEGAMFSKPGKRGIMPADKVSFYNRIDIGIFICFMDICLGHNGVEFEKTLYPDTGDDDKELVLNAKYRLCK